MFERDRRLAILASLGYLAVGIAAWTVSPATVNPGAPGQTVGGSMLALWAAAALLAILAWFGAQGRVEGWVILAIVGPLALYPLTVVPGTAPILGLAMLWPLSALPLGIALARQAPWHRIGLVAAVGGVVGVAVVLGLIPAIDVGAALGWYDPFRFVAVVAIVALPALTRVAMDELRAMPGMVAGPAAADLSPSQVTEQLTLVMIAAGPALAGTILVTSWEIGLAAVVAASAGMVVAVRIAVRPLAWIATRASAQRDLAVAAGEAERSRLAADLHDGPLQDVLLLARRLEATGDREGASMARAIGDELRDLSGDLRLPLLDDLGVGPALDWLVGRVRRMTALDVQVEYLTEGRVPPDVELAAFRIAQEAIANAVRHGAPPIVVRCRTSVSALSLSIEDAGLPSRERTAIELEPDREPVRGHFGLVNMQQRAEGIGGQLEWRRPRSGGTRIGLEWRAPAVG
jgi:signal transduction histidine kinase